MSGRFSILVVGVVRSHSVGAKKGTRHKFRLGVKKDGHI
jgi:hypothetical protein